jgi:hypothetical protein
MTGGEPPGVSDIVKMIKNVFSEFEGNNWAKIACGNISSQALSACLAESQFKGVPPSKRCVSGQLFCSAAISSNSTGSATDVAATDPVVVWFGRDKNRQRHFSNQANTKFAH